MAVNQTTAAAGSSNSFLRAWSDWLRELRASANQRIHAAQGEWISKARRSFDLVRNSDYALAALIALTWSVIFGGYIRPSAESTERVSVSSSGEQGNNESGSNHATSVSADGRYVAFSSKASNLVPNDTNSCSDVFVRDRLKGVTERVSVSSAGAQGGGDSLAPAISADGKYVAFQSSSGNFVAHDANGGAGDVFVRDRQTGTTELISVSSSGEQGSKGHGDAAISADGRFVAFRSDSPNLVPGDTNETEDVFVRDRKTRTTQRVSVSSTGEQANDRCGGNGGVAISADGRFVVFDSFATNLVPGDTNGQGDFFIHDRQTGVTQRVSLSSTGGQSDSGPLGDACSVSADGRFVVFASNAQTLVKGYSNCNVFIRDRKAKTTQIISVPIAGGNVNAPCVNPSITPDGRYVVFCSLANNLVPGDTNGLYDTFVRDRQTGVTRRVSVASDGAQGNAGSGDLWWRPSISADGKVVAFSSDASNLVREDTNRTTDVFVRCLSLAAARPRRPR